MKLNKICFISSRKIDKKQSLMAYWGPAFFEDDNCLSQISKNNLLQYKNCGFDTFIIPGIMSNSIVSNLNNVDCFKNSIVKKMMDYCHSINLNVLLRDNLIIYLSHSKVSLLKTSNEKKILFVSVYEHDVIGSDGNNYHFGSDEIVFLDDSQAYDDSGITFKYNRNVCLHIEYSKIKEKYFQFEDQKSLNKSIRNILLQYCSHPAFFGVEFWDEPSLDTFTAISQLAKAIKKVNKSIFIQQCLLPNYGTDELYGGLIENVSFTHYIDEYAKMCKHTKAMDYIRCDVYPLRKNESSINYVMNDYLDCLKIISKTASKYGLGWELCVQTYSDKIMQEIDNNKLMFQINAGLALGARNICYYTYTYDTHGCYVSGIVDGKYKEGYSPNKIYEYVKYANNFLSKHKKLFRFNKLIDCKYYQTSTSFIDDNTLVNPKNKIVNWTGDFIYSELKVHNGKRYAISPLHNGEEIKPVNLTIDNRKMIYDLINKKKISAKNLSIESDKILLFK